MNRIARRLLTLAGLVAQGQLERWRSSKESREHKRAMATLSDDERTQIQKMRSRGLLGFLKR